jgi:hypothetical protein
MSKNINQSETYDIRFYKNTGALVVSSSERYIKINLSADNVMIRKFDQNERIIISVSTNHKSEDFVIFYNKLENPEKTYRQFCEWQMETEEFKNSQFSNIGILEH